MIRTGLRRIGAALAAAGLALLSLGALAQETGSGDDGRPVHVAPLTGVISPARAGFITRAIASAEEEARALIIEMDTPGGLVDAMRDINLAILSSEVPVIVYVAPDGARATSAGTYILYASHLSAMAPGSTIGAATPVSMGSAPGGEPESPAPAEDAPADGPQEPAPGEAPDEGSSQNDPASEGETGEGDAPSDGQAMRNKVVNDSVAQIRSLAELRGRNADWAERAVREGVSLTANEALDENVTEILADDLSDLLAKADALPIAVR